MTTNLETAAQPQGLRRVAIDPVSRVEGHGKVTILLDDQQRVQQVRLHIVEFRGFEKFIEGRPYWEVPVMVQRLCGICPVSHHLAASKALDRVVGAVPVTPSALKIRRLMHYGQVMQSHALHFFHLSVARPAVRLRQRSQPPQHRRRGRSAPRHREEGRAAAQVRAGGDPRHRRQARARHRLGARRHEQACQRRRPRHCCCATCSR